MALLVDDLHWSDTESLRFLNYLAPRLDGLAVARMNHVRTVAGVLASALFAVALQTG